MLGGLSQGGSDDPDLDGQDNSFELIAGHDPNDADSCLRMESAGPGGLRDGVFRLNHVRPGVTYVLESSADMVTWDRLSADTYEVEGPGAIFDARLQPAGPHRQYWRVRVEPATE